MVPPAEPINSEMRILEIVPWVMRLHVRLATDSARRHPELPPPDGLTCPHPHALLERINFASALRTGAPSCLPGAGLASGPNPQPNVMAAAMKVLEGLHQKTLRALLLASTFGSQNKRRGH